MMIKSDQMVLELKEFATESAVEQSLERSVNLIFTLVFSHRNKES